MFSCFFYFGFNFPSLNLVSHQGWISQSPYLSIAEERADGVLLFLRALARIEILALIFCFLFVCLFVFVLYFFQGGGFQIKNITLILHDYFTFIERNTRHENSKEKKSIIACDHKTDDIIFFFFFWFLIFRLRFILKLLYSRRYSTNNYPDSLVLSSEREDFQSKNVFFLIRSECSFDIFYMKSKEAWSVTVLRLVNIWTSGSAAW